MSRLIPIEAFDNFSVVKDFPTEYIQNDSYPNLIDAIKSLDEREEFEPFLRAILADGAQTPHGPVEIVDIFTHKVSVNGRHGMAAFILKGKSFATVRHGDVGHQIYRLKTIGQLEFAIFAAPGTILDPAKEQFCTTCKEIGCDYAIFNAEDLARLFVAYGFFCPRDANRISSGRCKCGYSPPKRILNLLQAEALKELSRTHASGQKTGLVVLPPGSGKSRVAAEDALRSNAKCVLYVAHTHEILDVAQSEFEAKFGREHVLRLEDKASLRSFNRINIATINLLSKNLNQLPVGQIDYLVIDEFHHVAARSYRRVLNKLSPAFLLGLTATPFRGDQQNILQLCNNTIVVSYALRFGIETGVLCPYHYFGCIDSVNYSEINEGSGSYTIRDLERALIIPERDQAIIRKWREKAARKPTLAFCCSIEHAKRVAESFNRQGIPAIVYSSEMERKHREEVLGDFKSGSVLVLCVIDVLNEGADLPFVECLLFLRPTESKRIFFQQLGRGLRRYVGKSHCTVIDFIGNFKNAYKVLEYQELLPFGEGATTPETQGQWLKKDVLNVPLGCKVEFEDRVIELFYEQTNDPAFATRHTIGRILIYQYDLLLNRLKRIPTRRDIDRNFLVNSPVYATFFGSWKAFEEIMSRRRM